MQSLLKSIPEQFHAEQVLQMINSGTVDSNYLMLLKSISAFSDVALAEYLHLNVKTYRTYRDSQDTLRRDLQEHVIMLLSLMKHGISVFGNSETFSVWLETPNFFFDEQPPRYYLDTISGIKLIDDRLTSMEYGDNI